MKIPEKEGFSELSDKVEQLKTEQAAAEQRYTGKELERELASLQQKHKAELALLRARVEKWQLHHQNAVDVGRRADARAEAAEHKVATLISSADALLAYAGYHGEISRNSAEGRALIDGLCAAVNTVDPK